MRRPTAEKAQAIQRVGQLVARGTVGIALDDYYVSDGLAWQITNCSAVCLGRWAHFCAGMRACEYRAVWLPASAGGGTNGR